MNLVHISQKIARTEPQERRGPSFPSQYSFTHVPELCAALTTVNRHERHPSLEFNRKSFSDKNNIKDIITQISWEGCSLGPHSFARGFYYKFISAQLLEELPIEFEACIARPRFFRNRREGAEGVIWYGIFILMNDDDFLTFGRASNNDSVFRTRKIAGIIKRQQAEQDAAANP